MEINTVKRRLPNIPRFGGMGVSVKPRGKSSRKGAIHIELFFDVLGALGSVASILGFVMYLIDKTNKKKK